MYFQQSLVITNLGIKKQLKDFKCKEVKKTDLNFRNVTLRLTGRGKVFRGQSNFKNNSHHYTKQQRVHHIRLYLWIFPQAHRYASAETFCRVRPFIP